MIMHHLPPARRAVAYIFPVIILAMIAYAIPRFMETGRVLWVVYIFAVPLVLSFTICVEYLGAALGFDTDGAHFRSVGYKLDVPWDGMTLDREGSKTILRVTQGNRVFYPWAGFMYDALMLLVPYRARRANVMMTTIPLYAFTNGADAVMRDLRDAAPDGWT